MARNWTPAQSAAMSTLGRTLLISAAAGSGKTATLTERVIRRLTDPESPAELSRMLIVTFTRAASADMRRKLSAELGRLAAGGDELALVISVAEAILLQRQDADAAEKAAENIAKVKIHTTEAAAKAATGTACTVIRVYACVTEAVIL